MSGSNAVFRHSNTSIISVAAVHAPVVMTSAEFDARLAPTYDRLDIRAGLLESVAGIIERRWWPEGVSFSDAAAQAGRVALEESGVDPARIGLLVDTSVCRQNLEPSAAVAVHHELGLPASCINFDLANACLGFVNAMQLAATMIDAGNIEYALIVDGEGSRYTQETTLARLQRPETTVEDVFAEFATLTLGSGAAAMVLGPSDRHPEGHRMVRTESRAATQHHGLCIGTLDRMYTDTKGLLDAGLDLAEDAWGPAMDSEWRDMDAYILHQVSAVHTQLLCKRLNIEPEKAPLTFPTRGNVGPASVPMTLAGHASSLSAGDRVLCLGIGSGLNTAAVELVW
jgi:3-oxoacyl-[acyl-carrier-protein] synthase-3